MAVSCCLDSMLAFAFVCRKTVDLSVLTSYLQKIIKPSHCNALEVALLALKDDNDCEPFYKFLESTVAPSALPEYLSFYPRVFVFLLQFFALDVTFEIDHETVLFNLMGDLSLIQDMTKLSQLEKKDYAQMISIVSSILITPYYPCKVEEESRNKYAAASYFLGSRLLYLLDNEKREKESLQFWNESPVTGYKLSEYWEESAAGIVKQCAKRFKLPAVHNIYYDDDDDTHNSMEAHNDNEDTPVETDIENATVPVGIQHRAVGSTLPIPIGGLKKAELQTLLTARGLPSSGKKEELKQALVNTGAFSYETSVKKRKVTQPKNKSGRGRDVVNVDGSSEAGDTD